MTVKYYSLHTVIAINLRNALSKFSRKNTRSILATCVYFGMICCLFSIANVKSAKSFGDDAIDSDYYNPSWPKVAWLMTFPNSGTIYTTQLVQVAADVSTATNFGNEAGLLGIDYLNNPEYSYGTNGPFRSAHRPLPKNYILTKTHCSGHDIFGSPKTVTPTTERFVNNCGVGVKRDVHRKEGGRPNVGVRYDPGVVGRSVHLLRDPFDNVVARFHFAANRYKANMGQDRKTEEFVRLPEGEWGYGNDPKGFRDWCRDLDEQISKDVSLETIYGYDIAELIENVPCHGHFYQYIHWHNRAFAGMKQLGIPSLPLYYEDFHYRNEEVVKELLDFLELPHVGENFPFKWSGSHAMEYYTEDERAAIFAFVKLIASTRTFNNLERYFDIFSVAEEEALA